MVTLIDFTSWHTDNHLDAAASFTFDTFKIPFSVIQGHGECGFRTPTWPCLHHCLNIEYHASVSHRLGDVGDFHICELEMISIIQVISHYELIFTEIVNALPYAFVTYYLYFHHLWIKLNYKLAQSWLTRALSTVNTQSVTMSQRHCWSSTFASMTTTRQLGLRSGV